MSPTAGLRFAEPKDEEEEKEEEEMEEEEEEVQRCMM